MRLIMAAIVVFSVGVASADDDLLRILFTNTPLQERTGKEEVEVKQETKRHLFLPGGVTPKIPRSLIRPTVGARLGVFVPTSAEVSRPNAAASLGLFFRFPIHPIYNIGRFELALDTAAMHMSMDRYQNGSIYDAVWEDYMEVTLSYLFTFPRIYRYAPNFYLGFGFGLAGESRTYRRSGSTVEEVDEDSAIFIARLGWDSYNFFAFEVSIRVLTDSQRNIASMACVSFCIHFP